MRTAARARTAALVLAALLVASVVSAAPRKLLIEFGWDEPDTRFMREHIAQLQASPFDGCVFHADYRTVHGDSGNFAWQVWGRRRFTDRDLDSARADLRATRFGRFRENFLRVNVTPGDLDWFEDHSGVMGNLEAAARLARDGGCRGVLFDIEQYQGKLWSYPVHHRHQSRPWDELAAQARKRGSEVMQALERGYPGLVVFMTGAYSLCLQDTRSGHLALPDTDYGLLAPFLDGMVAAASRQVRIVDGHELSYGYREPELFAARADTMRLAAPRLAADPARYRRMLSVSFGLWLDYDSHKLGWDTVDPSRNHFPPGTFARSLQAALDHADRYVWVYTQEPRWWTAAGGPRDLPAPYDSVLRAARR